MMLNQARWSAMNLFRLVTRPQKSGFLLGCLSGLNLALIGLHVIHTVSPYLSDIHFSLDRDRGYAELWQGIQIWLSAILLWGLSLRRHSFLYGSWALILIILVSNDMTQLHELGGVFLAQKLALPTFLGLAPEDCGQLLIYAVLGLAALGLVSLGYRNNWDGIARPTSVWLMLALFSLVVCGELFDVIQQVLLWVWADGVWVDPIFLILEEGGELFIASLILWFLWRVWCIFGRPSQAAGPQIAVLPPEFGRKL